MGWNIQVETYPKRWTRISRSGHSVLSKRSIFDIRRDRRSWLSRVGSNSYHGWSISMVERRWRRKMSHCMRRRKKMLTSYRLSISTLRLSSNIRSSTIGSNVTEEWSMELFSDDGYCWVVQNESQDWAESTSVLMLSEVLSLSSSDCGDEVVLVVGQRIMVALRSCGCFSTVSIAMRASFVGIKWWWWWWWCWCSLA